MRRQKNRKEWGGGAGTWGDRIRRRYWLRREEEQPIFLHECLWVWRGVEEVGRNGNMDLVGNVALARNTYSESCNPWGWTNGTVSSNCCVGRDGKSGIHQRFDSRDSLWLTGMTVWARGGGNDESHLDGWGQKNYRDIPITCLTQK